MAQSKRWVFTLNNFAEQDVEHLRELGSRCQYLVFGRETGANGTPHLQGFVIFFTNHRLNAAKAAISARAHLEVARGTSHQAAEYCKKENAFEEFGQVPNQQGRRNDFHELKEWVLAQSTKPSKAAVAEQFPSLFIKYGRIMEWIDLVFPSPVLVDGELNPRQAELLELLQGPADDRKIIFVVDPLGGTGKSWFIRYCLSKFPEQSQRLSIGKRDDLAYAVDEFKSWFLFDVPRTQSEFLQYSVLEQLKDGLIFSPKYLSRSKMLVHKAHVVVFTNEEPDYNKLSADRYVTFYWHNDLNV